MHIHTSGRGAFCDRTQPSGAAASHLGLRWRAEVSLCLGVLELINHHYVGFLIGVHARAFRIVFIITTTSLSRIWSTHSAAGRTHINKQISYIYIYIYLHIYIRTRPHAHAKAHLCSHHNRSRKLSILGHKKGQVKTNILKIIPESQSAQLSATFPFTSKVI